MDWRTVPYGLTTTEKEWADGGLIAYRLEYPRGPLSEHFKRTDIGRIIYPEPDNTREKQIFSAKATVFFLRWVIGVKLPESPVEAISAGKTS